MMVVTHTRLVHLLLAVTCLACPAAAGCGRVERGWVSGTVTVDGAALPMGLVMLEPLAGAGPQAAGSVAAGRFEIGGRQGVSPGDYLVRVVAPDLERYDPAASPVNGNVPPMVPLLAAPWNDTSSLTVSITTGANQLDLHGPRAGPPAAGRRP